MFPFQSIVTIKQLVHRPQGLSRKDIIDTQMYLYSFLLNKEKCDEDSEAVSSDSGESLQ